MDTPGDRLRAARLAAGFKTAADAAEALGVPYPTYAGHENATRGFGGRIDHYAQRLGVRGEWLRNGTGPMKPGQKHPVLEEFDQLPPEKQQEAIRFLRWLKAS